jgi:hypothetical protein
MGDQSFLLNDDFDEPSSNLTTEQAEELRKKRLERFGPVETATSPPTDKDGTDKDGKQLQKTFDKGGPKSQIRCKHWPKCNFTAE